jgi:chorismate dehydratase
MPHYRVGAVSYLNTKPLIHGLSSRPECSLRLDLPSRLSDGLLTGQFDVALVPIVTLFDHPEWVVVSDACIACRGPVWSVKLCSRVPADRIKSLGLDEGSRTSAILARILLQRRFGLSPVCQPLPINSDWQNPATEAVLVIGDRAIRHNSPFPVIWDLGEEWFCEFGLPFVFAVWAARPGLNLNGLGEILSAARDRGLSHLQAIADAECGAIEIDSARCLGYLRDNLHFRLGDEELRGLDRFYRLAVETGLAPDGWELNRYDCATVG